MSPDFKCPTTIAHYNNENAKWGSHTPCSTALPPQSTPLERDDDTRDITQQKQLKHGHKTIARWRTRTFVDSIFIF